MGSLRRRNFLGLAVHNLEMVLGLRGGDEAMELQGK